MLSKGCGIDGGFQEEEKINTNVCDRRGYGKYLGYTVHHTSRAKKHGRLETVS